VRKAAAVKSAALGLMNDPLCLVPRSIVAALGLGMYSKPKMENLTFYSISHKDKASVVCWAEVGNRFSRTYRRLPISKLLK